MEALKILVVDDEGRMRKLVRDFLVKNGYEVLEQMRAAGNNTPVLMLTALGQPADQVKGLRAGADDYLSKPFDLDIFQARLDALIRRTHRDDVTANQFLMEMQRLGCCFGNLQDRRNAVQIYQAVYNVVPKAIHSGNSEQELKTLPIPEAQKRQRYYLWFCPPKEDAHFDATPEELLKDAPYTGQTKRAGFLDRCMADSTLPQRLYDLCQCGSELYYCDCCGKR